MKGKSRKRARNRGSRKIEGEEERDGTGKGGTGRIGRRTGGQGEMRR